MNVLIIHAHENPESFCSALLNKAREVFERLGHECNLSDLYEMDFNPVGGRHDFTELSDREYYKYALEQLHANEKQLFQNDIEFEIGKLLNADLLIFNFPLWWYSMPAILKGWVDRVMAYGVAYGGQYGMGSNGRFKGRKALLTITTGTPIENYPRPIENILLNINEGVFGLLGYEVLDSFIASGVSRITGEEREEILENYEKLLKTILIN